MRIRRLRIGRLPGIDASYELTELGPGVNVVHGPNASGKSSLARAFRALACRDEIVDGPVELEAVLELEDAGGLEVLRVERIGGRVRWWRGGAEIDPPRLPERRHLDCFAIAIDDLLAPGDSERRLAERVARELGGGYDVRAVGAEPPFKLKQNHGREDARALGQAEAGLQVRRRDHQRLRAEADRLGELRATKATAERAAAQAEVYSRALALLAARGRRAEAQRSLAQFSPDTGRLHGDEGERLAALADRESTQAAAIRQARGEAEVARRRQAEEGLAEIRPAVDGGVDPRPVPDRAALAEGEVRIARLHRLAAEGAELRIRVGEASAHWARAARGLGAEGAEPARLEIRPSDLADAERLLAERRRLASRRVEIDARLAHGLAAPPDAEESRERHRAARAALGQWLRVGTGGGAMLPGPRWLGAVLDAGMAIAALGAASAALRSDPSFAPLVVPVLALTVVWSALAFLRHATSARLARLARVAFEGGRLAPPASWARADVELRLAEIERDTAALAEAEGREPERRRLVNERAELMPALEGLEEALGALAERVGFDLEPLDASFDRWLRLTAQLDDAGREHDAAMARWTTVRDALERERRALVSLLGAAAGGEAEPDPERLDSAFRGLRARVGALEAAARDAASARERLGHGEAELAAIRSEREALLDRVGLGPAAGLARAAAEAELVRRLRTLEAFRVAERALADAVRDEDRRRCEIGAEEALGAPVHRALAAGDEAALRAGLVEAQAQASGRDAAVDEIARIEERIAQATGGTGLADAMAARDAALAALHARREEALLAEAGQFLLEEVEAAHVQASRSAVLARAAALFGRFTAHRFELEFDAAGARDFAARDTAAGERIGLAALSVGTRMQLLLALRLAFAEELERGGARMPLFVDEALATADPARFEAVASSLAEIARRDGRQVIYLSAQPGEAGQWRALGLDVEEIDLGRLRARAEPVPSWSDRRRAHGPTEVPAPGGDSPARYAERLGAPALDPWADPGAAHLLHLLADDLASVHRLLELGIVQAGQLEGFVASGAVGSLAEAGLANRLRHRAAVLAHFLEAWREGRGRPIAAAGIADSGAVTPRFSPEVAAVFADCGGDAQAAMARLEAGAVKGFGSHARARLAQWLEGAGHLDRRTILGRAERLHRVLGKLAASGAEPPPAQEVVRAVRWLETALGVEPAEPQAELPRRVLAAGA